MGLRRPFYCSAQSASPEKTAFISGTGAGIGRSAAEIFAAEGALVFGCEIDADAAAETVEIVEKAGGVMRSLVHSCAAGAPHRIRVNTIAPGMTRTSATAPFLDDPEGPKAQLEARIPVGRVGQPEDIARVAAFLCSDEAAFVNDANLMVDGGDSAMAG